MFKEIKNILNAKQSMINIFSTHTITYVNVLTTIILTPFILHRIGSNEYGVWVILTAIIGYINFPKSGLSVKMLKDLSSENQYHSNDVINSMFFAILYMQLIIIPIIFSSSLWLKIFIKPGEGSLFLGSTALFLLYLSFLILFLGNIFSSIFYSKNMHYVVNILVNVRTLLNFLLVLILGWLKVLNIVTLALVQFLLAIAYIIVLSIRANGILPFSIQYRHFNLKYIKESLVPCMQYFIMGISTLVIFQTDSLVISSFIGTSAVTLYALGFRVVEVPQRLIWAVTGVLFPKITSFYSKKYWSDLKAIIKKIFIVVVPLNIILSIALYFFGIFVLKVWVGSEYIVDVKVLNVIIAVFFIMTISRTYSDILVAVGKQNLISNVVIIEAILNLIISIMLVRKIGLIGVAYGTLISHTCTRGWFAPYYAHRHLIKEFRS